MHCNKQDDPDSSKKSISPQIFVRSAVTGRHLNDFEVVPSCALCAGFCAYCGQKQGSWGENRCSSDPPWIMGLSASQIDRLRRLWRLSHGDVIVVLRRLLAEIVITEPEHIKITLPVLGGIRRVLALRSYALVYEDAQDSPVRDVHR